LEKDLYDLLNSSTAEAAETTTTPDAGTNLLPGFSRFMLMMHYNHQGHSNYMDNRSNIYTEKEYADLKNQRPTMADVAGPTTDASGKTYYDDGSYTIPGFTRLKNPDGAPGNYTKMKF
jgi:hypothetical protein